MFAVINLYLQLVYAPNLIEIIVPTVYDKDKENIMNIKWLPFFYTPCIHVQCVLKKLNPFKFKLIITYCTLIPHQISTSSSTHAWPYEINT